MLPIKLPIKLPIIMYLLTNSSRKKFLIRLSLMGKIVTLVLCIQIAFKKSIHKKVEGDWQYGAETR